MGGGDPKFCRFLGKKLRKHISALQIDHNPQGIILFIPLKKAWVYTLFCPDWQYLGILQHAFISIDWKFKENSLMGSKASSGNLWKSYASSQNKNSMILWVQRHKIVEKYDALLMHTYFSNPALFLKSNFLFSNDFF